MIDRAAALERFGDGGGKPPHSHSQHHVVCCRRDAGMSESGCV